MFAKFRRVLLAGVVALLPLPALAGSVPLLSGPVDPGNLRGTLNSLIVSINTNVGTQGSGGTSSAIYIPTVASAVNLLEVTPGATGNPVLLNPIGGDTNVAIVLSGAGTGAAHLGGTTASNASVRAPTVASAVNQVQLSGAITGSNPIIAPGGSLVDTNVGLSIRGAGSGTIYIGGITDATAGVQVVNVASAAVPVVITPGITGSPVSIAASSGNIAFSPVATAALSATTGYVMIGVMSGTPTGIPAGTAAGRAGMVYDSTNHKICFYDPASAAWRCAAVT